MDKGDVSVECIPQADILFLTFFFFSPDRELQSESLLLWCCQQTGF